jgi:hypothetical protein
VRRLPESSHLKEPRRTGPPTPHPGVPADDAFKPIIKAEPGIGLSLNLKNKPGRCRVCGAAFMGPGNQKYCKEHSASIKYKGKA